MWRSSTPPRQPLHRSSFVQYELLGERSEAPLFWVVRKPEVLVRLIGASLSEPTLAWSVGGSLCFIIIIIMYRWYVRFGPRGRFRLGHSPKHKTSMPQAESFRRCRRTRLHAVRLPAEHSPKQRRLTNRADFETKMPWQPHTPRVGTSLALTALCQGRSPLPLLL